MSMSPTPMILCRFIDQNMSVAPMPTPISVIAPKNGDERPDCGGSSRYGGIGWPRSASFCTVSMSFSVRRWRKSRAR